MNSTFSRRAFSLFSAGAAAGSLLPAQTSVAHVNVAELDRATILTQAKAALTSPVQPPPGQEFHTETEPVLATAGATAQPKLLRDHARALQTFSANVAALTAGFLVTQEPAYAQKATEHLRLWLLTPGTQLKPAFDRAGCMAGSQTGTPAGVVDLVPLAEVARALSLLTDTLTADELEAAHNWFTSCLRWLNDNRQAFIARESKDHRASAHLLLSAACARLLRDENTLEDGRKRFRTHTLRQQIRPDGVFPQEVATPNPYRNTLFNFDLLGGACQLLSSQFDLLWDYELIDGVGFHIVAAYLFPVIAHPERWGYPADAQHFRDLPGRRPALLFSGRAYNRPEYVELWQKLPAIPPEALLDTFPIRQPALWTARAPHGL